MPVLFCYAILPSVCSQFLLSCLFTDVHLLYLWIMCQTIKLSRAICVSYPTSNDIRTWNNFLYVCVVSIFADKQITFSYISLYIRYYLIICSFFFCMHEGHLRRIILIPIVCDPWCFCSISCQIKIYYANEKNVFAGKYFHDQR